MRASALGLSLVLAASPASLLAQPATGQADPREPERVTAGSNGSPDERVSPQASSTVDVDRLGVSVDRIRRELRQTPPSDTFDGSRLRSYVYVYGAAPPIRLFREGDRTTTPAPHGGMTHTEFLNLVTPREFRSPTANIGNVGIAISDWFKKRAEERRRQEERERLTRER